MTIDKVVWTSDTTYALRTLKYITWMTGTWPLQEGIFPRIRFSIAFALGLAVLVSLLMEIQLNCGDPNEKLDFLGMILGTTSGLTKILFLKIYREDIGRILSSALKDWASIFEGSPKKDIMRRYAQTANFVCRFQLGTAFVIVTAMILDALPSSDPSFSSNNETISGELVKRIPLRTMCIFGNMSTSTYWTVFIFQGIQLVNASITNLGHDCFFFGVSMYICGQFDTLTCLYDEVIETNEDDRDQKLEKFIDRHSYLLDLARGLQNILDDILAVLLICVGLHICFLGIQVMILFKNNEIIALVKSISAFVVVLGQIFLYSYSGENLSSSSQNIHDVIYNCPWYEYPLNTVRNLIFVIARALVPLRITAGRFYTMNMESFKDILKASFSYISVLGIMFE